MRDDAAEVFDSDDSAAVTATSAADRADPAAAAGPRRILGLALPTLGVLVAEPIYLLFDLAVVGRLGALALAGLAVGGLLLAQTSTQLTFLSYGTTARASTTTDRGRTVPEWSWRGWRSAAVSPPPRMSTSTSPECRSWSRTIPGSRCAACAAGNRRGGSARVPTLVVTDLYPIPVPERRYERAR